jgi:hypothetical protein
MVVVVVVVFVVTVSDKTPIILRKLSITSLME